VSRLAVIIGAGPGVGASVARALGQRGFDLALIARNERRLTELGESLQAEGVTTGWTPADAADLDALRAAVDRFGAYAGRIGVLHHNLSVSRSEPVETLAPDDLQADLRAGALSLLAAVQAALPYMTSGGLVLATGSGAASRPMRHSASVGVQKAALRNLVAGIDTDLRDRGIRAATLTVNGTIERGTAFDPDHIAAAMMHLLDHYDAGADDWRSSVPFNG